MLRKDFTTFLLSIPQDVTLVVASKYIDSSGIREIYSHNIKSFGENRTKDFLVKYEELKDLKDIEWHFIGHLQTNKAKDIINKIDYLESLDSLKLADIIEKYASKPLKVFVEVSINLEENKNGVPYYELEDFLTKLKEYKKIELVGLMMMAVKGSLDTSSQFRKLRLLRDEMEQKLDINIPYLSMGMSDDYLEAINEGATHIRLGRILFK